jgi:multimeric flavodoxin WrbA
MSVRVVGIPGSLREGSFNRGLLRAAIELAPAGMEIQMFTRLGDIPPYNADVDDKGNPEPVQALKTAIREANAMLIATPEYNYGVPGVLKNAIDWASRPAGQFVLNRKPAAIMGCSQDWGGPYERNTRCVSPLYSPTRTPCSNRRSKFLRWRSCLMLQENSPTRPRASTFRNS